MKYLALILIIFSPAIFAQNDISILYSTSNSIIIEYRPNITDISEISVDNKNYVKFELINGLVDEDNNYGLPQNPYRLINLGVPSEFGNTIEILELDEDSIITGFLAPIPSPFKIDNFYFEKKYLQSDEYDNYKNDVLVTFSDFGYIRNLPTQGVKIYPIKFEADKGIITTYKRILFRINFSKIKGEQEIINDEVLSLEILNYETAKNWGIKNLFKQRDISSYSNFSSGSWYKFSVIEEGIYKIDYSLLQSLGINLNTIDPRTIKIFNNGGYQLPENIAQQRPDGLIENAIVVVGENDGSFDSGDYILFYGRTTDFWEYNTSSNTITRSKHSYSKQNYYFLTFGGSNGKRMEAKNSLNNPSPFIQTKTKAYKFWDEDKINIGKSGRNFLGDEFSYSNKMRTYTNHLSNVIPSTTINYNLVFVNASTTSVLLEIKENNNLTYSHYVNGFLPNADLYGRRHTANFQYSGNLTDEKSQFQFIYNSPSDNVKGYIDYFTIQYEQYLKANNNFLLLFSELVNDVIEYQISNFSSNEIFLFDVSDFSNVKKIIPKNIAGNSLTFQDNGSTSYSLKYIAVTANSFLTPNSFELINNTNLRNSNPSSELLIISNKNFQTEAERLANYKRNESPNKLSTMLVYVDEIFNEFSCGMVDPVAIRDFLKYAYDNYSGTDRLRFCILLGDGTYDFFNVEGMNNNFVPTYQTSESLNKIGAYSTDDFYTWIVGTDKYMDISLGRLTVNTLNEAAVSVDKIIDYEKNSNIGNWRNRILLIADDGPAGDKTDGDEHTKQSENISTRIPNYFEQNKIYLVEYPEVFTGEGRRKPEANTAIINGINNESLITNYIGHGSPSLWAHERVFEQAKTLSQLQNRNYFFLTVPSCSFGWFDNPKVVSGTEELLIMQSAGIIAGFSSSRVVFSTTNAYLMYSLYSNLLDKKDQNYFSIRLGDAVMLAKNANVSQNTEKFILFGDPTIRLHEPRLESKIDSVNNKSLDSVIFIKALEDVKISGTIKNMDGSVRNFDGETVITIYDSEISKSIKEFFTDRNNVTRTYIHNFKKQGGALFRGRASVRNGKFSTSITIPKDISNENRNGKIVSYFYDQTIDGVGYSNNIIISGIDTTKISDGNGPDIKIYFDNIEFENSYLVGQDFTLFVKLSDNAGINTTGLGVGHRLEGIINNDYENAIDLTNYFIGELDAGGKEGVIKYDFYGFETGDYTIKIRAWDIFNNLSEEEEYFTVVDDGRIVLRNLYNYPNPFSDWTYFTFQHNLVEEINVSIKIYTIAGRMIKEIKSNNIFDKYVLVEWDGRDEDGDMLANGTYLYKLNVETIDGKFKENLLGKLAVIR
ncbi:MAG: type IX secretion system sortase PorU [Ignavibacteriales bacterium]|nr:type IX secretion system sortase PorU [Ignavibacteriales bacterium]